MPHAVALTLPRVEQPVKHPRAHTTDPYRPIQSYLRRVKNKTMNDTPIGWGRNMLLLSDFESPDKPVRRTLKKR